MNNNMLMRLCRRRVYNIKKKKVLWNITEILKYNWNTTVNDSVYVHV